MYIIISEGHGSSFQRLVTLQLVTDSKWIVKDTQIQALPCKPGCFFNVSGGHFFSPCGERGRWIQQCYTVFFCDTSLHICLWLIFTECVLPLDSITFHSQGRRKNFKVFFVLKEVGIKGINDQQPQHMKILETIIFFYQY